MTTTLSEILRIADQHRIEPQDGIVIRTRRADLTRWRSQARRCDVAGQVDMCRHWLREHHPRSRIDESSPDAFTLNRQIELIYGRRIAVGLLLVAAVLEGFPIGRIRYDSVVAVGRRRAVPREHASFRRWALNVALRTDDPVGDLVGDMRRDQYLPEVRSSSELRRYLISRGADRDAVEASAKAWDRYMCFRGRSV